MLWGQIYGLNRLELFSYSLHLHPEVHTQLHRCVSPKCPYWEWCFSSDIPLKAYVSKAWSSGWCYGEMVAPLKGVTQWLHLSKREDVRSLGSVPLRGP